MKYGKNKENVEAGDEIMITLPLTVVDASFTHIDALTQVGAPNRSAVKISLRFDTLACADITVVKRKKQKARVGETLHPWHEEPGEGAVVKNMIESGMVVHKIDGQWLSPSSVTGEPIPYQRVLSWARPTLIAGGTDD